ncbi:MAG: hypothetical protein U5N56_09220 [Candidatus Marinimicrobia bacterium]|nr:hypothetical protein [Candidatus Neomarinimicrobiota bacterium]
MRHHSLVQWEKKLKSILDEIDIILEKRYGGIMTFIPHGSRTESPPTARMTDFLIYAANSPSDWVHPKDAVI